MEGAKSHVTIAVIELFQNGVQVGVDDIMGEGGESSQPPCSDIPFAMVEEVEEPFLPGF